MKEIRWHARAGQGAKTAAQLLAVALLREGKSVQAFPEYGPERRGSPMRAYTRYDDRPIRRHDSVEEPDAVVVLEPSLAEDPEVIAGLKAGSVAGKAGDARPEDQAPTAPWGPDGLLLINSERPREGALCVPAARLAPDAVNLVMLGALAAALGEPAPETLVEAADEVLGRKANPTQLRIALEAGFAAVEEQRCAA